MSGQPTRAGLTPDRARGGRLAFLSGEWRQFAEFLRHPTLPDRAHLSLMGSVRSLAPLFALDLLLMAIVLGGIGVATSLGFKLPQHMLNELKLSPLLLGFIIVGAPLGEEAVFRGWLSGRPGHILAVLGLLAGFAALALGDTQTVKLGGAAAGLVVALAALIGFRRRDAVASFQRHFAWFYYASAVLFAAIHLTNFAGAGLSPAMLPLVLPQLLLGLLLGYLRVNRGLLTGAALHMLHNSAFAALMLAGVK